MLIRAPAVNACGFSGDIQVVPAYGSKTDDYVTRLGRAYMPVLGNDGRLRRLADRLQQFVDILAAQEMPPDLILLDARAGLHDLGAAAVTQLGAQVFVFGRDEPQGWTSQRQLLTHLKRSRQINPADENNDLRLRLKCVAAMVEDFGDPLSCWIGNAYDTWCTIYDEAEDAPYAFSLQDEEAPHYPLPIAFTAAARRARLTDATLDEQWNLLAPAFQRFIDTASALLIPPASDHPPP
ncbi:MAG: hypothetical protein HQL37_02650 [Alphaproteobacteria bacterium]|nr:hypothetical protein [Alphaproteobacteria bacterium]